MLEYTAALAAVTPAVESPIAASALWYWSEAHVPR